MSDLILTFVNKLATAVFKMSEQLCHVRDSDFKVKDLIQVLLLQVIIQSKIRLTANDFMSFRKTFSLSQKTVSSDIFTEFMTYNSLNISEKKSSILNLIKDIQEFNLLCRQISNQLYEKSERNLSFTLIKNEILKKMNYIFVLQQKIIQSQLLKFYHDYFNKNY